MGVLVPTLKAGELHPDCAAAPPCGEKEEQEHGRNSEEIGGPAENRKE